MAREIEPIRRTLAQTIGALNIVADVTYSPTGEGFVVSFGYSDRKPKLIDFMTARDLHDLVGDIEQQLR